MNRIVFLALSAFLASPHAQGAAAREALQVPAVNAPVQFEAETSDSSRVRGQIDLPAGNPRVAVVLVAGTGPFDRDVYLGASRSDRDLIFLDLARSLTEHGAAVARYDKRGVRYHKAKLAAFADLPAPAGWWSPDPSESPERAPEYATADSGPADLKAVYDRISQRLPGVPIVILAHSEGMLHVAQAVERGDIAPAAIVGMGALMESPVSAFSWQRIERIPQSLASLDANGDTLISNDEVRAGFFSTPAAVFGQVEAFLAPDGTWTPEDLAAMNVAWTRVYEQESSDALAHNPEDLLMAGDVVVATYGWWRIWFTDTTPVATRLAGRMPVRLFYGAIDSQTPADRQQAAVAAAGLQATIDVLPGLGHTLGSDVFRGPLSSEARTKVVEAVFAVVGQEPQAGTDRSPTAASRTRDTNRGS